jgi:hypothetical protein
LCIANYSTSFDLAKKGDVNQLNQLGGKQDFWREIITAGCSAHILVAVFVVHGQQFMYCPLVLKLRGENL